jgi:thiosulfate/3-mercaptopyruvate sulfurtransferase
MDSALVSPEWLVERLDDPTIAIVDCRFMLMQPELGRQQYEAAHIPGAYYLDLNQDLSSPVNLHGGRHPLPNPLILAKKLAALGVQSGGSTATQVIAYDDSRFAFAARLWWLLRYFGHESVAVLDGGWAAWQAANYPVSTAIPAAKLTLFTPNLQADWVVDRTQVIQRKTLPTVALVDAREGNRYRGEQEPVDPIAGHIPGAVNLPWQEVTNAEGWAKPVQAQRDRWAEFGDRDEIIVYCGSGVTACVNLLSLELAGIKTGKLYAGSWSDWCSWEKG